MGLQRCFLAEDRVPYRRWRGGPPLIIGETYNTHLVKTPRVYEEELSPGIPAHPGILWVRDQETSWGPTVIRFFAPMACIQGPGWKATRFTFDGRYGRFLTREDYVDMDQYSAAGQGGGFAFEPSGWVWAFGANPMVYGGDAVVLREEDMHFDTSLGSLSSDGFLTRTGVTPHYFLDFNVDRIADRMFVRWSENANNCVSIYRLSTKTWLADIYVPNRTTGIVLTHDGCVYLVDENDWICVYDYDGTFYNAFKNPRREAYPGGLVYGWDKRYKRLLFLAGLANATDGASRMRIRGYYPVPEAAILTPPIPRQVPRAGRKVVFVAHLAGEGAEPLSGRRASFTGDAAASAASDKAGDIQAAVSIDSAGSAELGVRVDVPALSPEPVEQDETIPGKTLVVDWVSAEPGPGPSDTTFTVSVTGAVAGTLTIEVTTIDGWSQNVVISGSGSDPDALSVSGDVGAGAFVTAVVTDSAGNTGMTNLLHL